MSKRLFDIMTAMIERYAVEHKLSFKEAFDQMCADRGKVPLLSLTEYHEAIVRQRDEQHRELMAKLDRLIDVLEKPL